MEYNLFEFTIILSPNVISWLTEKQKLTAAAFQFHIIVTDYGFKIIKCLLLNRRIQILGIAIKMLVALIFVYV